MRWRMHCTVEGLARQAARRLLLAERHRLAGCLLSALCSPAWLGLARLAWPRMLALEVSLGSPSAPVGQHQLLQVAVHQFSEVAGSERRWDHHRAQALVQDLLARAWQLLALEQAA